MDIVKLLGIVLKLTKNAGRWYAVLCQRSGESCYLSSVVLCFFLRDVFGKCCNPLKPSKPSKPPNPLNLNPLSPLTPPNPLNRLDNVNPLTLSTS